MVYSALRPFMRPGDLEPNYHYRPWLEKYIGEQDESWCWRIVSSDRELLEITFFNPEDAVFFEISWI